MIQSLQSRQQLAAGLFVQTLRASKKTGPGLPLLLWAIIQRRWLDPKNQFDLSRHLYLKDIYNETAREIIVKKASQLGLSEWLVSYALHACDERKLDVVYLMPTERGVSDFSQTRFGPALEASPYLAGIIVGGADKSGKRGSDQVMLKRVGDSFLYFRGGQVSKEGKAHQLKSIPGDVLVLDELDEMDSRAPEIARKRLSHSETAEVRAISTPTYPGRGIDLEWARSDQREWFLKCGHCGQWQFLTINHIVTVWDDLERPVAWHGQAEERAFAACRKCGREMDRLAKGVWVPQFPGREVAGFHPTRLISPLADLLAIVQSLQTTNETKRRETVNQDLGETYTPRGGQLTDEILDACRREYGHGPYPNERPVMGVDVGKVLHGVIRGERGPASGEWPQRWAGEMESWDELGRMMRRFKVKRVVIDAEPETTKAREFQAAWPPGVVWLAYVVGPSKDIDPIQWNEEELRLNMDRTRTLDKVLARFYEGKNTLPANAREVKDYYAQLKAPVRVLETNQRGRTVATYIEKGPDHLAFAENFCMAAMEAPEPPQPTTVSRVVKASEL
ncbi:MAG: phage terminase large subunit family protein [Anaerolineae bacterium]|nr:phage terminase large subunit family protein [Anaerolineae bacterium]